MEFWADIEGYEGFYEISHLGRVKSLRRTIMRTNNRKQTFKENILKPVLTSKGYLTVNLHKVGKVKTFKIHRLLALSFIDNPDNKPQVNHIDGIKTNNRLNNLEWNTSSENTQHAYNNSLLLPRKGIKHHMSKITEKQVLEIRASKNKTHQQLADDFQLSRQTIGKIINRKRWKHI